MISKIVDWGEGKGLLLPMQALEEARMVVGDDVVVTVREGRIIVEAALVDEEERHLDHRIDEDLRALLMEHDGWFAAYNAAGERLALTPTLAEMYEYLESQGWPQCSLHAVGDERPRLRGPSPRIGTTEAWDDVRDNVPA
jgi:antitoxin component of MazEF toxin-antitoxin module